MTDHPRVHYGYEHVKATGHRLALSSVEHSNCAECDWTSDHPGTFLGYHGCPEIDWGENCWTPEDCSTLGDCRHLYRRSLNSVTFRRPENVPLVSHPGSSNAASVGGDNPT